MANIDKNIFDRIYETTFNYIKPELDKYVNMGGYWYDGSQAGLFRWDLDTGVGTRYRSIGARLLNNNEIHIYNDSFDKNNYSTSNIIINEDGIRFVKDSEFTDFDRDFMYGLYEKLNDVFIKIKSDTPDDTKTQTKDKNDMNETYLKTDASKLESFDTGAKREDKSGKGRYDLIPGDVMREFEDFVWETYFKNGITTCSASDVSKSAYFEEWRNIELYYDFIFNMISFFFVPSTERVECTDDCGETSYEISWDGFRSGLYEMRKALAIHYEAGAKVHGVDNWKKGIPIYGSDKGGCFLDSMRRHTDQALQGKTDEPHAVAAIWNAFGAIWTLKNDKNI